MSFDPVFAFGTTAAAALIGLGITHALDSNSLEFPQPIVVSELVVLGPGSFEHPQAGEFLKENHPVAAPVVQTSIDAPLEIMKYQVSVSEYGRCVADAACKPADPRKIGNVPVTGVSHIDAVAYATWLSARTGEAWRLPTDVEWAYAAGERFRGDIEGNESDPTNPVSHRNRPWAQARSRTKGSRGFWHQLKGIGGRCGERLGMDLDVLRPYNHGQRRRGGCGFDRQLRSVRCGGVPPHLYVELHQGRQERRLRSRNAARQSGFQTGPRPASAPGNFLTA